MDMAETIQRLVYEANVREAARLDRKDLIAHLRATEQVHGRPAAERLRDDIAALRRAA